MTTDDKEQNHKELSYRQSGVDVEAGYALVDKIKPFVEKTKRPEILSGLGSFSALSRIPKHIKNPILVTALNREIGYEKAALIAKKAYKENRSVIEVAHEITGIQIKKLKSILNPANLTKGGLK